MMQTLWDSLNISHVICGFASVSLTESSPDEERSVWCRKRVVTFWEVKSTVMVAELNHTHWLSFTSQPQVFEIVNTLANSVMK